MADIEREKRGKLKLGAKIKSWERVLLLAACRKRGGGGGAPNSTPVVSWKQIGNGGGAPKNTAIIKVNPLLSFSPRISARKLAAALWEFQYYFGSASMYLGGDSSRRNHHHHRDHTLEGDHDQPATAGSLRRHVAASLMRHQSGHKNHHNMAQYNPGATSDSSVELKGRIRGRGESSYGFKTSTELLKVLNRIWTLEEQHASNMSLVKALKTELDHARAKIKDLLRDQQANRRQIDELMKQISEDNLIEKTKGDHQEDRHFDAALGSVRFELEEERKLRKRSENLHRKLARELFEVKVALSTTAKELEREKKSRELLEELCDEFAKGVREYAEKFSQDNNWLVHMSESWLDERAHPSAEKLSQEIDALLIARKKKVVRVRRRSLESIPEVATPPGPGSRLGEPSGTHEEEQEQEQEELSLSRRRSGQGHTPPSVQMSDIQSTKEDDPDVKMKRISQGTPGTASSAGGDISMLQKSDVYDSISVEGARQRPRGYNKEEDKLMRELLGSEGKEATSSKTGGLFRTRNASPVRQWVTSVESTDTGSSSRAARDNSLKAKLQEPKTKGPRARLKILKGSL